MQIFKTKKINSIESVNPETTTTILFDISNKKKSEVLAALYNNIIINNNSNRRLMNIDEADRILNETTYIYTIDGNLIAIDFSEDTIDVTTYDNNYGKNSAEHIISMCSNVK